MLAVLLILVVAGGVLFYRMVGQLETMTRLMGRMTDEVASIHNEMTAMRISMERMEGYLGRLDSTLGQGARDIQRVNPMNMMERMVPGAPGSQ
jgi:hypothetical protein